MDDDRDRLSEIQLDTGGAPPPRRSSGLPVGAIVGVVVVLVALAGWWLWSRGGEAPAEDDTVEIPTTPPPETERDATEEPAPEPEIDLPPLEESDPLVRDLVAGLSANPQLAAMLVTDDLVRRFVVTVDNVAEGVDPARHWPALRPQEGFAAEEVDGRLVVSPESYDRYDLMTDVFTSLDTEGSVELYRQLEPLLDEAYRELGYPDADFDDTLERAIRRLLRTPVPPEDSPLVENVRSYAYRDPTLENLTDAQKVLLRMGPENQRRIQAKLEEFAEALGVR